MDTSPITLPALVRDAYANSAAHGFHDGTANLAEAEQTRLDLARLMLITSEAAEACECVRVGHYAETARPDGKPEGLPSELADIVIRVADFCGARGIDLDGAVRRKMAHNAGRPRMHGKRA